MAKVSISEIFSRRSWIVRAIGGASLATLAGLLILGFPAHRAELKISELGRNLAERQQEERQLKEKIKRMHSLERIQAAAAVRLDLGQPKKKQIRPM